MGVVGIGYTDAMDSALIFAYSTIVTAVFALLYAFALLREMKRGTRVLEQSRRSLDEKMSVFFQKVRSRMTFLDSLYARGIDEVERDLIDPVTRPLVETKRKYTVIKTGTHHIRRTSVKKASPHLQELLQKSKDGDEKGGQKKRRRSGISVLKKKVRRKKKSLSSRGTSGTQ